MPYLLRTDSTHPDFVALVRLLDADLAEKDGEDHAFYAQFNKIDRLQHVLVANEHAVPLACGAMKTYEPGTMEIKRMFVLPESRNRGLATSVLAELEKWAAELGYTRCILETGKKQVEAIGLYNKNGYTLIPNYGQYAGVENSLCFEKQL